MADFPAVFVCHHLKNCFAYVCDETKRGLLNQKSSPPLKTSSLGVVQVVSPSSSFSKNRKSLFVELFSLDGEATFLTEEPFGAKIIGLSEMVASEAHIQNGDVVIVKMGYSVPTANRVEICPLHTADWEIFQLEASRVEETFLEQISVLQIGMTFPFWINQGMPVMFKVAQLDRASSDGIANVSPNAEILVEPPSQFDSEDSTKTAHNCYQIQGPSNKDREHFMESHSFRLSNFVKDLFASFHTIQNKELSVDFEQFRKYCHFSSEKLMKKLRILSADLFEEGGNINFSELNPSVLICCDAQTELTPHSKPFEVSVGFVDFDNGKSIGVLLVKINLNSASKTQNTTPLPRMLYNFAENLFNRSHPIKHAIISGELRLTAHILDFTWISFRTVADYDISNRIVAEFPISTEYGSSEVSLLVLRQLQKRCHWLPLVLSESGLSLAAKFEDGSSVSYLLRPNINEYVANSSSSDQDKDKRRIYLIFLDNCEISVTFGGSKSTSVKEQTVAATDRLKTIREDNESEQSVNFNCFARDFDPVSVISCQSETVAEIGRYVEYQMKNSEWLAKEEAKHVLLTGDEGGGKTTVGLRIASRLFRGPLAIFSLRLQCSTLRGKNVENVEKKLKSVLEACESRWPSILVLDNLDQLCPSSSGVASDHVPFDVDISKRLVKSVWRCFSKRKTVIVATARSIHSLNQAFLPARGRRFFAFHCSIKPLEQEDRLEVFASVCNDDDCVQEAAKRTAGFVMADLYRAIQRARLTAAQENLTSEATAHGSTVDAVRGEHLLQVIEQLRPVSQRSVQKLSATDSVQSLQWTDLGGMHSIKQLLIQVFIWPSKYPYLYKSSGVETSRGVLLHGPSGCGKTLIAKVLAAQSNLNFISVKGPELLSKYIGASEQSVRETFMKARSSKPCLIFFDEFDALAPRRGHDSTGVTDRVVNQLLTELDGVEGLDGVYVLAATSRPDLLDPALLRPGRVDYLIYCGLPDKTERVEILRAISRRINIDKDVDLEETASQTEGWSGAHLTALITHAQFNALRRLLSNDSSNKSDQQPSICMQDLKNGLNETRPRSVKSEIYDKLRQQNGPVVGNRVTLA